MKSENFTFKKASAANNAKVKFLEQCTSDQDFGSLNGNDAGEDNDSFDYNSYAFHKRYQKKLETAQPMKVDFKFSAKFPARFYGYALVLTNKLASISSDGQRHFDLF